MDHVELAVLPGADTQQEAHHIRLLVSPNLLHVLVCTHDERKGSKGIQQVNQTGWYKNIKDPRRGKTEKRTEHKSGTRDSTEIPITEDVHHHRWSMVSKFE